MKDSSAAAGAVKSKFGSKVVTITALLTLGIWSAVGTMVGYKHLQSVETGSSALNVDAAYVEAMMTESEARQYVSMQLGQYSVEQLLQNPSLKVRLESWSQDRVRNAMLSESDPSGRLGKTMATLEAKIDYLELENQSLTQEADRVATLKKELAGLQGKLTDLQRNKSQLNAQINALEADLSEDRESHNALLASLNDNLSDKQAQIDQLREQLEYERSIIAKHESVEADKLTARLAQMQEAAAREAERQRQIAASEAEKARQARLAKNKAEKAAKKAEQAVTEVKGIADYRLEGEKYAKGIGVNPSMTKAVTAYTKAAELGDAISQHQLGAIYERGQGGIKPDLKAAQKWYEKSANQGYALSQHNLGALLDRGGDKAGAFLMYLAAAKQDLAIDQFNVGAFYLMGTGVEADEKEGLAWMEKAAINGHDKAKAILSQFNEGA